MLQISASIYYQISPDYTVAKTSTKNLGDIDFPAAFKVCIKPSFNDTEISVVGYNSSADYFLGKSKYDAIYYGWAGHTKGGGVFSTVTDVQDRIFQDYHSVIKYTGFVSDRREWGVISKNSYQLTKPNYLNNCLTLEILKHFSLGERLDILMIGFESKSFATDIDIIIEDQLTLVDRTRLYSTRKKPINHNSLNQKLTNQYLVSFEQNTFLDAEKNKCTCKLPH